MIDLRTLGAVDLRARTGDRSLRSVLSQSKRIALLAYLASSDPKTYVRRDTLVGLFWPERTEERARHALSQALHVLRRGLDDDVIETNGDEQLRLNRDVVWCDASAFEEQLRAGDIEGALELYRGEFLEGLNLSGVPEFERWVDEKREQLRSEAAAGAAKLAEEREAEGRMVDAVRWARRAANLNPYDEGTHRRLVTLLARAGDPTSAVQAFQAFSGRLRAELELEPSEAFCREADEIATAPEPREDAEVLQPESLPPRVQREAPSPAAAPPMPLRHHVASRLTTVAGVSLVGLAIVALIASFTFGDGGDEARLEVLPLVGVAPFLNATGDSTLDPLGVMAGDWIRWGLQETGLVRVANSLPTDASGGFLIRGSVYSQGDSLLFSANIVDVGTDLVVASPDPVAASKGDPAGALLQLRQSLMGQLASLIDERMRRWSNLTSRPPTLDAYRHFTRGLDFQLSKLDPDRALEEYLAAAEVDPDFTLPLIWAVWANQDPTREDSLLNVLETRRAGMPVIEQHLLDYHQATNSGATEAAYKAMARVVAMAPESGYLYKAAVTAILTNRQMEAVRLLERADPDEGWLRDWPLYWISLARARHAVGDHEGSAEAAREGGDRLGGRQSSYAVYYRRLFLDDEARALGALGRVDEIAEFLDSPRSRDSEYDSRTGLMLAIAEELESHGFPEEAEGYWRMAFEEYRLWGVDPRTPSEWIRLTVALSQFGYHDEAFALVSRRKLEQLPSESRSELLRRGTAGVVAANAGREEDARAIWNELELGASCEGVVTRSFAQWTCRQSLVFQGGILAALGERKNALAHLGRALQEGLVNSAWMHRYLLYRPLWDDPDFHELIRPSG